MIIKLIDQAVTNGAPRKRACRELGLDATTLQRWRHHGGGSDQRAGPKTTPSNKLSPEERESVIDIACSSEFRDLSPKQVVPLLADQGRYVASESTFYRFLRTRKLLAHRGPAKPPVKRARPMELEATGPCQVWTWDITYLPGPIRGSFYYLYLVLDVWSRKVVGWSIHTSEDSIFSAKLIDDLCATYGIKPGQLALHSDNGSPMKGATMLATLYDLGVAASFSRPRVSNDNPYSESHFRTMKYRPEYPSRPFASLEEAELWVTQFVDWYNNTHLHSGIQFVTPASRHEGRHHEILRNRKEVYAMARARNPERWSRKIRSFEPTQVVSLNPEPAEVTPEPAA